MSSACLDPSRHLAAGPRDSVAVLGRAMMRGAGAMAVAVVHRAGGEVHTHLYLVPEALVGGRAEVRLAAVFAGERVADAAAAAAALPGFEAPEVFDARPMLAA